MTPDERPSDEIIDDDNKFDKWYEDYIRKIQRDAAQRTMNSVNKPEARFEDLPSYTSKPK